MIDHDWFSSYYGAVMMSHNAPIELAPPNLGEQERENVNAAIASGHVGPDGPFVARLEEMVAKATGREWAIATITGTAALHASAYALWGFRPSFRIWSQAFPAMANVRQNLWGHGAIGNGGLNHDVAMYECRSLVVADRAPAIGEPSILNADIECYSFAANKIVTCGHGGAIVGDDPLLRARLRSVIRQGYGLPDGIFNYRMANINAAIGCAQMDRLGELKQAKRRIWDAYSEAGLPMVQRGNSRWMSTIRAPESIVGKLKTYGIVARSEPAGVSIPCGTGLSEDQQERVIDSVTRVLQNVA